MLRAMATDSFFIDKTRITRNRVISKNRSRLLTVSNPVSILE